MMKPRLPGIAPLPFFGSAIVSLALIGFAAFAPDTAARIFKTANTWVTEDLGWLYMLSIAGFVIFLVGLALSPLGNVKLGPDDSTPDYSYGTWVAMLFSGGMGIGIVFYGVAEPMTHYSLPPDAPPGTAQAMRDAMAITFFHWGIHAWSIFGVVGLALAYFGYRKGDPLVLRSAFRPMFGDRINGPIGDFIDIFAVVGTLAGLSTSLGLGVSQLNATGAFLMGFEQNIETQLILIGVVTALATVTVATGLDNGIRRMSEIIIIISFILMGLVLVLGPTRFLLAAFVENIGLYVNSLVPRTFHIYAYEPTDWVAKWTLFYWGWWMSTAPFVGLFIARISRGRSIRQFVIGVLFAPAGFSLIWFTIFGNTAIWLDVNVADGQIARTVAENMPIALFTVFDYLPLASVTAWITGLLVAIYFVTTSDAGALVIAMITSKGDEEPPVWMRVFWAIVCGSVAAFLLMAGGLEALQTAAVVAALPLCIVMIFMCFGVWKALRDEVALKASAALPPAPMTSGDGAYSWRRRLSAMVSHPRKRQIDEYLAKIVAPALQQVHDELSRRDLVPVLVQDEEGVSLSVPHGEGQFLYNVRAISMPMPPFAMTDAARNEGGRNRYYRAEVFLTQGSRGYDIYGYEHGQIIADVINHYDQYLHYLGLRN